MRVVLGLLALGLMAGCGDANSLAKGDKATAYRKAQITRTDIVRTVEATGTVTPRNSPNGIPVGAQVNGKIIRLLADYNSPVTNGQVVALIDPQVYDATYRSSVAQLHVNEAKVKQAEATLTLAEKTLLRKQKLRERDMCSEADLDLAIESRDSAIAQLDSARASVEQSVAAVSQAKANLEYCTIRSPVNGVVIDRKVEEGETVVSSMNAVPVLTIAEDLKTIWIEATIPEADVGSIRIDQPVTFTADAYRRRFYGRVKQVRRAATTTNNVVTFPVIIEAENPDEMLFPGMTATLSIETACVTNALAVASAALRFRPRSEELTRVVGEVPRGRKLWFEEPGGRLRPVAVEEGVSNDLFTEVAVADDLVESVEGAEAIVGYQTAEASSSKASSNPFMPKFPKSGTKGTAPEAKK